MFTNVVSAATVTKMPQSIRAAWLFLNRDVTKRLDIPTGDLLSLSGLAPCVADWSSIRPNLRALFLTYWTSLESDLCFQARRRLEADKHAKALEIYNAEFSTIYRLPPELMLDIFDHHLTITDVLTLRQSCRRYAALTRHVIPHQLLRIDRPDFKARLRRDRFYKLADAESAEVDRLETLLCSYSQGPHPKSVFQCDEVQKTARTRRCVGLTAAFRACQHLKLTYDDLLKCQAESETHACPEARHRRCNIDPWMWTWKSGGKGLLCLGYIYNGFYPGTRPVTRGMLQDLSKELAEKPCPHMNIDDPDFQRKLKETDVRLLGAEKPNVWKSHVIFAHASRSVHMTIPCSEQHCHTDVDIRRWVDIGEGSLLIKVYHDLGPMETP